jgi:hypothetical protein
MNLKAIAGFSAGTILAFALVNLIFIGTGAAWLGVGLVGLAMGAGAGTTVHFGFGTRPVLGGVIALLAIWAAFIAVALLTGHVISLAHIIEGAVNMGLVGAVGGFGYKLFSR